MGEHTPGPWKLIFDPEHDHRHHGISFELEKDGFLIQGTAASRDDNGSGMFSNDIARANARLIAAAPDLLRALRELADAADSFEETRDNNNDILSAIDIARAIIDKATGVEP